MGLGYSAPVLTGLFVIALFAALSFLESLFYIFCVVDSRQNDVLSSYLEEIKRLIDVRSAGDIVA